MSKGKRRFADIILSLTAALVLIYFFNSNSSGSKEYTLVSPESELNIIQKQNLKFGFNPDSVHIENNVIRKNEIFGNILSSNGIATNLILLLEHEARNVFNIRNIQAGKKYHVIKRHECDDKPLAIVYEPDKTKYVIYNLSDSVSVQLIEKDIVTATEVAAGKIETSLWNALDKKGIDPAIIDKMEEALSSNVDFYHARKGDEFKLIYESKYVDKEYVGMGKLIGASYKNSQGEFYSMLYKTKDKEGYFDSEGRPARKAFLKAPVKFSRISSSYNLRRFHPIKQKTMAHLGTDYAAPYGTEIRSVADGVVIATGYTSGNGNFVKVRHDKVYETQYLHMSKFAKGIKSGTPVKQGQTIGYVGATGLATGPHVCFRFWKNGKQVNHLNEKLPSAEPMHISELPDFFKYRDEIMGKLLEIRMDDTDVYPKPLPEYVIKP
ncbi:MAG: peptidoglycan DD-metalloendopeptidase family protein [Saprospiraceae bacterium]|nr:peptidoglycan DD-metalloendopeptidase family protein [Saprospiraceae bacterium]